MRTQHQALSLISTNLYLSWCDPAEEALHSLHRRCPFHRRSFPSLSLVLLPSMFSD